MVLGIIVGLLLNGLVERLVKSENNGGEGVAESRHCLTCNSHNTQSHLRVSVAAKGFSKIHGIQGKALQSPIRTTIPSFPISSPPNRERHDAV